ncbi:MAG: hypothetical protein R3F31_19135 [Verrucomicrobiales bacterium]
MSAAYADGMQVLMVPPTVLWLAMIQLLVVLVWLGGSVGEVAPPPTGRHRPCSASLAGLVALVWKLRGGPGR